VSAEPAADEPSAEQFAERAVTGDSDTCIEKPERPRETLRPSRLLHNFEVAPHVARAAATARR
jgi:hypothetical protein